MLGLVMSAAPSPSGRPFVTSDLDTMPDDGYRREVIGGVLIVKPAPVGRHQICLFRLSLVL